MPPHNSRPPPPPPWLENLNKHSHLRWRSRLRPCVKNLLPLPTLLSLSLYRLFEIEKVMMQGYSTRPPKEGTLLHKKKILCILSV
jgi:hypothetical protein